MNPKIEHWKFLPSILISLVVMGIPSCLGQNDQQYQTCNQPFQCGRLTGVGYPFWGGNRSISWGYPGFELNCQGDDYPLINIASTIYRVLDIDNRTQTLRVSRNDLQDNLCPTILIDTTLNFSLFYFYSPANDQNITLYYGCNFTPPLSPLLANIIFNCSVTSANILNFFVTREVSGQVIGILTCNNQISVRVNQNAAQELAIPTFDSTVRLQAALQSGFSIEWLADNEDCNNCVRSGGLCGYNQISASFACHCTNGSYESTCIIGTSTGDEGTYK